MTRERVSHENADSDYLVMLLSADWAERFLPFLGIEIAAVHQAAFRSAARDAVKRMMSGKDNYFYVDFTPERIAGTRALLLAQSRRKAPSTLVAEVDARFTELLTPSKDEAATINILGDAAWSLAEGETESGAPVSVYKRICWSSSRCG